MDILGDAVPPADLDGVFATFDKATIVQVNNILQNHARTQIKTPPAMQVLQRLQCLCTSMWHLHTVSAIACLWPLQVQLQLVYIYTS
jgi:hypothetical protein